MRHCIWVFILVLIYPIRWVALRLLRLSRNFPLHSSKFVRRKSQCTPSASAPVRQRGKPAWVKTEVLRLKALMPVGTGVRKIAATFNRMQRNNKQVTKCQHISKTYVANLIGSNLLEIHNLRTQVRTRAPGAGRPHRGAEELGALGLGGTGCFAQLHAALHAGP